MPAVIHYFLTQDTVNKMIHATQLHQSAQPEGSMITIRTMVPGNFSIDGVPQMVVAADEQANVTRRGCRKAQAIIATLVGEHTADLSACIRTVAILVRPDGQIPLKDAIS